MLAQNKVDFVVRSGENWLTNMLFNWVIPFLIIALIWSWIMRRATAGRSLFSIWATKSASIRIPRPKLPLPTWPRR